MILLLATTLAATACTTAPDEQALRDREWKLAWVEAFPSMPSGVATPTIRFGSDGRISGNTGCNSIGADYTAEGDRLRVDMMMLPKRACLDPEGNRLESAYVAAVGRARRFRITSEALELLDENGLVVARFE